MFVRSANDHLRQIIVIVQSEAAAQVIADLNGDNTRKGNQMPTGCCGWSREETLEFLNRTTNIEEPLKMYS